jgi:ABC-type transport system involved in multi-copper enzyme maturation permease subunit
MTPAHFLGMFLAELRKTLLRGSGLAALAVAAAIGALAVGGLAAAKHYGGDAVVNGAPLDQLLQFQGVTVVGWSLRARNFFLLPLVLLWATGTTFAGEWREHTLRELCVRPVPRWAVLCAKLGALCVLSGLTLVVTGVVAAVPGALLFGAEGDWGTVLLGYLASWASDLGLLALGILASLLVRNVAGVVVGVILFLVLDLGLRLVLKLAGVLGLASAETLAHFLPGEALAAWEGYSAGWSWIPFAGLGTLLALSLALSLWRLARTDIP